MRLPYLAAFACAFALSACSEKSSLTDALMFPPGIDIQYQGQPAKLYGDAQCAQGQLSGHTCLIFAPHTPYANGSIISGPHIYQVKLKAFRDPHDPSLYRVEDEHGTHILSTTGRHSEHGILDVRPAEYAQIGRAHV